MEKYQECYIGSDHNLVGLKFELKLKKVITKYGLRSLKNEETSGCFKETVG